MGDPLDDAIKGKTQKSQTSGSKPDPICLHVTGNSANWTYWQKFKAAMSLLGGGNIYYSFCNSVTPAWGSGKKFLGMEHAGSEAKVEVTRKKPKTIPASQHSPVTRIRVVKDSDLKIQ